MRCPVAPTLTCPVADAASLGADRPLAVRLLDQDWVLWRDATGQPQAAPDRCPHRGTRLSLGQVCAGELQCPYHGWRFDGQGRCTAIPALPGFQPPAGHGLAGVRPLLEARGLLWLRPDGGAPQLPGFAAEDDARLRKLNVGPFEVASSAPRIVENFLDMAHFGFVHAGWLGDATHTEVPSYQVTVDADVGLLASGCRAWQPHSHAQATEGRWVDYVYRVPTPFAAVLEKVPEGLDGYRESYALLIQPMAPDRCRVWFRMAVADWQSSDEALSAFQRSIFLQDQPVLESQQPACLPLSPEAAAREVHCAADRSAMAYRRYLALAGVRYGTC
jgi:phenylpropionate dioxygenase-like ring-hydroxylating dioxygenase large terminal subunit